MNIFILIFILGVLVGGAAVWFFRQRGKQKRVKEAAPDIIEKQAKEKEEKRKKILEYFVGHRRAANDDIEQLLNVSDATATRYLEELEKEGKIRQVGKTGRHVYYERT